MDVSSDMNDELVSVTFRAQDAWVIKRALEQTLIRMRQTLDVNINPADTTANFDRQAVIQNVINQLQ